MSNDKIININTVSIDVLKAFDEYVVLAVGRLHLCVEPKYRQGFIDGVKALQMEFLDQCPGLFKAKAKETK